MQIGSLTAFLMYLMQILMSVMMATFMAIMIPRAAVCAERIGEVLDTDSSVVPPVAPVPPTCRPAGELECATSSSATRVRRRRCCAASRFAAHPGRPRRSSAAPAPARRRCSSLVPRLFDATGGARAASTASTCATCDPRRCGAGSAWCRSGRTCSPARSRATCATATRTPPTSSCGQALEVAQARDFVEAMPQGLEAPIAQGGTNVSGGQRQRLAIARALVRQARDLPVRRLVLGARPRDRRPAARRAATRTPGTRPSSSSRSGCRPSPTPTRSSCSRTAGIVGKGTHEELLDACPTYQEIVESQLSAEEAA